MIQRLNGRTSENVILANNADLPNLKLLGSSLYKVSSGSVVINAADGLLKKTILTKTKRAYNSLGRNIVLVGLNDKIRVVKQHKTSPRSFTEVFISKLHNDKMTFSSSQQKLFFTSIENGKLILDHLSK